MYPLVPLELLEEIKKQYYQYLLNFSAQHGITSAEYFKEYVNESDIQKDKDHYKDDSRILATHLSDVPIPLFIETYFLANTDSVVSTRQQSCINAIQQFLKYVDSKQEKNEIELEYKQAVDIFGKINIAISLYYRLLNRVKGDQTRLQQILMFTPKQEDPDYPIYLMGKSYWEAINEVYKSLLSHKDEQVQKYSNQVLKILVSRGILESNFYKEESEADGKKQLITEKEASFLTEARIREWCAVGGKLLTAIYESENGELPYSAYKDLYKQLGLDVFNMEYHTGFRSLLKRETLNGGFVKRLNRFLTKDEAYVQQRQDYLTAIICVTWLLYNESFRKYNKLLERGSLNVRGHKLNNFFLKYVEFATGREDPGYFTALSNFAYFRGPQSMIPLSSHHKKFRKQYGIDVRFHGDYDGLGLLPNGCTTLLFGEIFINDKKEPFTFVKPEPHGIGTFIEIMQHCELLFKSWIEKTDHFNREKDIPIALIKPFHEFCDAIGIPRFDIQEDGKCGSIKITVYQMWLLINDEPIETFSTTAQGERIKQAKEKYLAATPEQKYRIELAKVNFLRKAVEMSGIRISDLQFQIGNEMQIDFSFMLPTATLAEEKEEDTSVVYDHDFEMVEPPVMPLAAQVGNSSINVAILEGVEKQTLKLYEPELHEAKVTFNFGFESESRKSIAQKENLEFQFLQAAEREAAELQRKRIEAATTIQRIRRGMPAKVNELRKEREAAKLQRKKIEAATTIQRIRRGMLARVKVNELRKEREAAELQRKRIAAATTIQRIRRGMLARVKVNELRKEREAAELQRKRIAAATTIQRIASGMLAKVKVYNLKKIAAISRILQQQRLKIEKQRKLMYIVAGVIGIVGIAASLAACAFGLIVPGIIIGGVTAMLTSTLILSAYNLKKPTIAPPAAAEAERPLTTSVVPPRPEEEPASRLAPEQVLVQGSVVPAAVAESVLFSRPIGGGAAAAAAAAAAVINHPDRGGVPPRLNPRGGLSRVL